MTCFFNNGTTLPFFLRPRPHMGRRIFRKRCVGLWRLPFDSQASHRSKSWQFLGENVVRGQPFNSLWLSNAKWRQISWATLIQVMACCLTAPSHYLNQCWHQDTLAFIPWECLLEYSRYPALCSAFNLPIPNHSNISKGTMSYLICLFICHHGSLSTLVQVRAPKLVPQQMMTQLTDA